MARAGRQLDLKGVFASAITPHRGALAEADFSGALDLIEFIGNGGVQGICLLGAAGEFLNYTFAERQRLVYLGAKRSRVPLMAGVSHSTLSGAIQVADEAVSAGADGLLLMPPYFFHYEQREIEAFFLEFAREANDAVPLLIHNSPGTTTPLELVTVRKLIDSGLFAGVVDSGGEFGFFEELLSLKPAAVFCGCDLIAKRALDAGANGILSDCACVAAKIAVGMSGGDSRAAEAFSELAEYVGRFPAPVAIKRAVELRGQKSGLPLTPLAAETRAALDEFSVWFKQWVVRVGA